MSKITSLPDGPEDLTDDEHLKRLDSAMAEASGIRDEPLGIEREPGRILDFPTIKHPDIYEDVLEYFEKEYPDIIGTTPKWPRFDIMKIAYEGLNTGFGNVGVAMQKNDLVMTVVNLTSLISLTMGMAVVLGVDVRPLWVAAHKARMAGKEVDIGLLLDLQDDLSGGK